MKGKYLYGIIRKDKNHSLNLGGLTTVAYQSLVAVVTEKEVKDYHKLPKEETIRELIGHQQTIEKIMNEFPILPVRFGTILKDEEEVKSVLEKGYFFLRNTLRKIEDKIELDLVCFWDEQKAAQMACQKSKKIRDYYTSEVARPARRSLGAGGRDSSDGEMEAKITLGKLVADYLSSKREKLSNQVLKTLKKEAVENCGHALADVNMLLNQAFLVEKKGQEAFNYALNQLDSRFADLLNFRLVGPLPPYSFSTVVVDVLDKEEVEKAKRTLGLDGEITDKTVNHAYRQLAQECHPDKNAGQGQLGFDLINSAYKVLKDFVKRGFFNVDIYHWEEQR